MGARDIGAAIGARRRDAQGAETGKIADAIPGRMNREAAFLIGGAGPFGPDDIALLLE